jgi:copper chaperone CopZ
MNKTIKVKGMHCSACEMLIKDVLEEAKGVKKAEASLKTNSVSVDFDEKQISEQKIKELLKENGYGAA